MPSADTSQALATQLLADNALAHPLWDFDAHVQMLQDYGFDDTLVTKMNRAITEAIHYSRSLVITQAKNEGWVEHVSQMNNPTLWEDPETGLYWETESLIKEYLDRADA